MKLVLYVHDPSASDGLVKVLRQNHRVKLASAQYFKSSELEDVDAVLIANDVREDRSKYIFDAYSIPCACVSAAESIDEIMDAIVPHEDLAKIPDGFVRLGEAPVNRAANPDILSQNKADTPRQSPVATEIAPVYAPHQNGPQPKPDANPSIDALATALWPRARARKIKKAELAERLAHPHGLDVLCHELDADINEIRAKAMQS